MSEKKYFVFRAVFDQKARLAMILRVFHCTSIDAAWQLASEELEANKQYYSSIVEIYMLQDGEKGVSIQASPEKLAVYFDGVLEVEIPASPQETIISSSELN